MYSSSINIKGKYFLLLYIYDAQMDSALFKNMISKCSQEAKLWKISNRDEKLKN